MRYRIKELLKKLFLYLEFMALVNEAKRYKEDFFVLFGTPMHGNLGDHAIAEAAEKIFREVDSQKPIFEVPSFMLHNKNNIRKLKKVIGNKDILINGGGFLGTLWMAEEEMVRNIVREFQSNKVIILPQTLYFESSAFGENEKANTVTVFDKHPNLWLCMREDTSYTLAKSIFKNVNVLLIPDMVTYLKFENDKTNREGMLFCLRADKEKVLNEKDWNKLYDAVLKHFKKEEIAYTDTVVNFNINRNERRKNLNIIYQLFSSRKLVITDRLHGMIFAALTEVPCIAMGNCNYKVKGVYNWIKHNKYILFIEDLDNIEGQIEEMLGIVNPSYDNVELSKEFDKLKRCIKGEIV